MNDDALPQQPSKYLWSFQPWPLTAQSTVVSFFYVLDNLLKNTQHGTLTNRSVFPLESIVR